MSKKIKELEMRLLNVERMCMRLAIRVMDEEMEDCEKALVFRKPIEGINTTKEKRE